jgi:hypothetical protein
MRPEVILDGQMGSDPGAPARFWDKYPSIPAVRNHRVYGYPGDPVLHAGPRIGTSLEILASLIHPDAFRESVPKRTSHDFEHHRMNSGAGRRPLLAWASPPVDRCAGVVAHAANGSLPGTDETGIHAPRLVPCALQ